MTPKISVIVAVYKAENYLHILLDSLLNQTFHNFEILLVNDGSPDRSGKICDEFRKKDNRVRVFHKANEGVSATRQFGLEHSLGEYVIYADPDDWLDRRALEVLYEKTVLDNSEIVICDYIIETVNNSLYISSSPSSLDYKQIQFEIASGKLMGSLCNKLIKKDCFYYPKRIQFPQKMSYGEDQFVCLKIFDLPRTVSYVSQGLYHYCLGVNNNSLSASWNRENYKSRQEAIKILSEELDGDNKLLVLSNLKASNAYLCIYFPILTPLEYKKDFLPIWREIKFSALPIYKKLLIKLAANGHLAQAQFVLKSLLLLKR